MIDIPLAISPARPDWRKRYFAQVTGRGLDPDQVLLSMQIKVIGTKWRRKVRFNHVC
jgi:hypothetical protein